jgi:hypothetical protein
MAAYNRGDYVPAMQAFRAMAQQGNAKAQKRARGLISGQVK